MPRTLQSFATLVPVMLVVAACGGAPEPGPTAVANPSINSSSTTDAPPTPTDEQCTGPTEFVFPPVDLGAIEMIVPFGLMSGSHVTPVDHQYFQNRSEPDRNIDVYSPGDGTVTSIQHFAATISDDPSSVVDDYRIVIDHDCSVSSVFIHVDELAPRLNDVRPPPGGHVSVSVGVNGGELVGTFTENVDYNLIDLNFEVEGLIDPDSYSGEPWKIHVPDTVDYFSPSIAARLDSLSLRSAAPRSGRFAYDIEGRLVGNWFEEGTGGYRGTDPERYWAGHLTFAYDHIDPSAIVVSIGTFDGRSRQFSVLGNGPDPGEVSASSGVVVYDLVEIDYTVAGERWDRFSFATGIEVTPQPGVVGQIAVMLTGDRKLEVAIFTTPQGEITGLGPAAVTFTR